MTAQLSMQKLAQSMTDQDIAFNWTAFGKVPTEAQQQEIYDICLSIAEKVQDGAYGVG
jgi:hypothetical protein